GVRYRPDLVTVGFVSNDLYDARLQIRFAVTEDGYLLSYEGHLLGPWAFWLYQHSRAARIFLRKLADAVIAVKYPNLENPTEHDEQGVWERLEAEYDKILAICRRMGARMVVVNIPQAEDWDAKRPGESGRRLMAWCRSRGVHFVDVFDKMSALGTPSRFFYKVDKHCTNEGYAVIAQTIKDYLCQNGVVI
ncbi:MAG: hypothetical protein WCG06_03175, partial [Candidatus Omnitrophota bacterium]